MVLRSKCFNQIISVLAGYRFKKHNPESGLFLTIYTTPFGLMNWS